MGHRRNAPPDSAKPQDAQAFAMQFGPRFAGKLSDPQARFELRDVAGEIAHKPKRVFGNADLQHAWCVAHHNPILTRQRLIHSVVAHPEAGNERSAAAADFVQCVVQRAGVALNANHHRARPPFLHCSRQGRLFRRAPDNFVLPCPVEDLFSLAMLLLI